MPTITVITAVHPPTATHLPAAYASLVDQSDLPEGWQWEWLVQCDGIETASQETVKKLLPLSDPRISFAASRHGGPGVARTMALSRASGDLVKVLDADDRLAAGVLARDIAACSTAGVGWSTSRVLDVHEDGRITDHRRDNPQGGRLKSGLIYHYWTHQNYGIWVHPATLCARRWLLLALGGWMALPASEDTGLLMALDSVADGWFNTAPGVYYRRWGAQMSASVEHSDPAELAARRAIITARAEALDILIDAW